MTGKIIWTAQAERKKVARSKGLTTLCDFKTIAREIGDSYPTTKEELAQSMGVGMGKVAKIRRSIP